MKALPILVLLSSAVQLCSAAPALEPITCSEDSGDAMARLAMHHINEHHDHGYKFRLSEIQSKKVEKADQGCDVDLQLDLLETKCHVVNSKHFEDCEIREETEGAVMANCTVMMTVKNSDAEVTRYECDTRQVKTGMEMVRICPDCPTLIPLNSTIGLQSVKEAVQTFNQNASNQHYYVLKEVGRILSGYMMMSGMNYYAEIALVETHCPTGTKIIPEACKPLCPDRAHHALCHSSYSITNGLQSVECEFYPPTNTTVLGPGEREPVCRRPHPHGPHPHDPHPHGPHSHGHGKGPPLFAGVGGPPHHAGVGGPPHHAGVGGPPHHAGVGGPPHHAGVGGPPHHAGVGGPPHHAGVGGPPSHTPGQGPPPGHRFGPYYPLLPFPPCHGLLTSVDPALHPICPWPLPEPRANPKPRES